MRGIRGCANGVSAAEAEARRDNKRNRARGGIGVSARAPANSQRKNDKKKKKNRVSFVFSPASLYLHVELIAPIGMEILDLLRDKV